MNCGVSNIGIDEYLILTDILERLRLIDRMLEKKIDARILTARILTARWEK